MRKLRAIPVILAVSMMLFTACSHTASSTNPTNPTIPTRTNSVGMTATPANITYSYPPSITYSTIQPTPTPKADEILTGAMPPVKLVTINEKESYYSETSDDALGNVYYLV